MPGDDESTIRAIVVRRYGGPEVLEMAAWPRPELKTGHALVDVDAVGVNYRDIYEREGSGGRDSPPFVAGFEGGGRVVAVADDVTEVAPGDRVAWTHVHGSYAARVAVPVERLVQIPPGLSTRTAVAVLLQGLTAHYLCTTTYPVAAGETVLVHAAAGGTGLLLTQMVKLRGGRVIGTTSTEEKAALARSVGADEVIVGYESFAERVLEFTEGEGVAAVFDGVGGPTVLAGLSCLRVRGTLASFGSAGGSVPPLDLDLLRQASLFVTRPTSKDHTASRAELLARAEEIFGWVSAGLLEVRVGGLYPLEEARQAQIDLSSRLTTGKLLLLTPRY